MKSLKKLLSIFAAFMMVVGLTVANVNAEGEISITVTKPEQGKVYTAYRLLQANIGEGNAVAYFVDEAGKTALNNSGLAPTYFTISETKNPDGTYNVTHGYQPNNENAAKQIAAKFRNYLENLGTNTNAFPSASATAANNESVTISNLPGPGYYFVTTGNGSLVRVDTLANNATVENKKDQPTIDKTVNNNNNNTVNIGDEVEFTLTAKLKPGFEKYSITDTMTGLTFKEIKSVTKDRETVSAANYPFDIDNNPTNILTLTFRDAVIDALTEDTTYVITYVATVNDNAVIGKDGITNEAILKFGNNDNVDKSEVKLSTYKFDLTKTKDEKNTQLDGAEFELSLGAKKINFNKDEQTNTYTVTSEAIGTKGTTTTIKAGAAVIKGLANGDYTLTEIKAPEGYNKLDKVVPIKIHDGSGNATKNDDDTYSYADIVYVLNTQGTQLPSTGGMGTTMIYIAGAILMVGAAIIFVTNKRMKHE